MLISVFIPGQSCWWPREGTRSSRLPSHVAATEADTCQSSLAGSKSQSLISTARHPGAKAWSPASSLCHFSQTDSKPNVPAALKKVLDSHTPEPERGRYNRSCVTAAPICMASAFSAAPCTLCQARDRKEHWRSWCTREFCPTISKRPVGRQTKGSG